jgi:hypothetical protein
MQNRELNTCKQDIYSFLHFSLPTNTEPFKEGFGVVVSTGFFEVGRRLGCNPVREPTSAGRKSASEVP